ncbi:hypothetical protein N657DRAFT_633853 [Parathielavia appendiculata]|uniref:Heterokaryon incompatibility domain-containing protein n=1 Tax=Parathielavia appendiculata TaxID=2587402 RepID=A0AAN6Z3H4_9PEZI|nr:hypothetical protein N657DRAFT_633853 [Parathielavia appendiculata]
MVKASSLKYVPSNAFADEEGHTLYVGAAHRAGYLALQYPAGIKLLIVHSAAESDLSRHALFATLGVKNCEASEICRLILKAHELPELDPKTLTVDQLVSHAAFLYKALWQPPKTANLWCATTVKDEHCLGRSLYIPGAAEAHLAAANVFAHLQRRFPVVHGGYLKAFPSDSNWPGWLVKNLGLSMAPRMIMPQIDTKPQPVKVLENKGVAADAKPQPPQTSGPQEKQPDRAGTEFEDASAGIPDATPNGQVDPRLLDLNVLANPANAPADTMSDLDRRRRPILHRGPRHVTLLRDRGLQVHLRYARPKASSLMNVDSAKQRPCLAPHHGPQVYLVRGHKPQVHLLCGQQRYKSWTKDTGTNAQDTVAGLSPPANAGNVSAIFNLSEEFTFMFQECHSSDILQLLRDNWKYYAQWVDGPHMKWQDADFLVLSDRLKKDIGARLVMTAKGALPLQDTVLPMIDPDLDQGHLIPALEIEDPLHPEWALLSSFGVLLRPDIHYYLRCLFAISEAADPNVDDVAYVYKQIENRYNGNEGLISVAFWERDIVLIPRHSRSRVPATSVAWTNMRNCVSRNINVDTEYPITYGAGQREYDALLSLRDNSWFITDRPLIHESMHSKLPLLALPVEDLPALEDLTSDEPDATQGSNIDRLAVHSFIQARSQFIRALIPNSRPDKAAVAHQISQMRISIAAETTLTFVLSLPHKDIFGRPVCGQIAQSTTGHFLDVIMTQDCAAADSPPYELVTCIADLCGIKDPRHSPLLFTALSNSSLRSISSTFIQQGIRLEGLVLDESGDSRKTLGRWSRGSSTAVRFRSFRGLNMAGRGDDRRIPMVEFMRADGSGFGAAQLRRLRYEPSAIAGWEEVQFLGELMISRMLQAHLGPDYDPETHWTSRFRSRCGHRLFSGVVHEICAAFTIDEVKIVDKMTAFLIEHGRSGNPGWKEKLRATQPVYHIDVAVSAGGSSSFVITSSQVERMRQLRMPEHAGRSLRGILVLARVSDVYSADLLSVDLFIDPGSLFHSNILSLESNWVLQAALQETDRGSAKRRRRMDAQFAKWAVPTTAQTHASGLATSNVTGDDVLQGVVLHVQNDSDARYRALSYVWGPDRRTHELITPDGAIPITSSLDRALRRYETGRKQQCSGWMQYTSTSRTLAASTYAFLDECEGSNAAIEMLMQVRAISAMFDKRSKRRAHAAPEADDDHDDSSGTDSEYESEGSRPPRINHPTTLSDHDWPAELPRVPPSWWDRPGPPLSDPVCDSVRSFFAGAWFRRAWVIQETVAFSSLRIVCGKWLVDWTDLHMAMETVDRENFRHAESTLRRDRLFALLGLASDGNETEFEPDYDAPLESIVLRFARVFVRQGKGVQLLYRAAGLNSQAHDRFPSWMPNWTAQRPGGLHELYESGNLFPSCGVHQARIKYVPDTDELVAEGYSMDAIKAVSTSSNVPGGWREYFKEVDAMVDSAVLRLTRESREDLKWKVPIACAPYPKLATAEGLDLRLSYQALRKLVDKDQQEFRPGDACLLDKKSAGYVSVLQDTLYGWKFIVTEGGHVGDVPNGAQAGDVIAVLKGARVPFALRKSSARPELFVSLESVMSMASCMVKDCYYQGLLRLNTVYTD